MIQSRNYPYDAVQIGDLVYFWRDNERWLGPASVIELGADNVTLTHNGYRKTHSMNRICKIQPPLFDEDEDESEDESGHQKSSRPTPEFPWISSTPNTPEENADHTDDSVKTSGIPAEKTSGNLQKLLKETNCRTKILQNR